MSIEKMSLVQIGGNLSALNQTLMTCCDSELFHIELPSSSIAAMGLHPPQEKNLFAPLLETTTQLLHQLNLSPEYHDFHKLEIASDHLKDQLQTVSEQVEQLHKQQLAIKTKLEFYQKASAQVIHLRGLDVRFNDLVRSKNTVTRFGRLPVESYEKLAYFSKQLFFFLDFDHDDDYYWGIYIAPTREIESVDRIFETFYFEEIVLPDFATGTPEIALQTLEKRITKEYQRLNDNEKEMTLLKQKQKEFLLSVYSYLQMKAATSAYQKYAIVSHNKFFLEGFVPTSKVKTFLRLFEGNDQVVCDLQDGSSDPEHIPPTKLRTAKFFKPFESFVEMYGLPDYNGINPTSFIGFLYVLIFGIMFGDLGQGLILAIGGALYYRKTKMPLAAILSRCGMSSAFFGVLFGSVFGFEHLLDPLHDALGFGEVLPIHAIDPDVTMSFLIAVLGLGILITIVTISMNIVLKLKQKNLESALFSNNGVAGLIFYVGVIAAVALLMLSNINILNPIFILFVIVLPLLVMFLREPLYHWVTKKKQHLEGGVAGFIMQNFFEVFEMLLGYIANTLSFLRIAGFVLSHAGMMAVVMTLAEQAGSTGSIPVIILGNVFVMILEAFLVAIQVLRLTFYEIFSRFYEGDGKPFNPIKIHYGEND